MTKILAVEDETDLREMIRDELGEHGYTVSAAADGREAVQMLASFKPDLILSDISMPEMGGYELLQTVRNDHPSLTDVPFVFLTALSSRENQIQGREFGADDYVTKPIDFDVLLSTIATRVNQVARMRERKEQQFVKLFNTLNEQEIPDHAPLGSEGSEDHIDRTPVSNETKGENNCCPKSALKACNSKTIYGTIFDFPNLAHQQKRSDSSHKRLLARLRAKALEILRSLVCDADGAVSETTDGAVLVSYKDANERNAQIRSQQLSDELQKEISDVQSEAVVSESSMSREMVANALIVSESLFEVSIPVEALNHHESFECEIQKVVNETRDNKRAPTLLITSIKNSGGHLVPLKIFSHGEQTLPICFFNYDQTSKRKMRAAFSFFGDKNKEKASYLVDAHTIELLIESAKLTDANDAIVVDVHFDTLLSQTYRASYAHNFLKFADNTRRSLIVNIRSIPPDTSGKDIVDLLRPLGKYASRYAVQVNPAGIEEISRSRLPVSCIVCSYPELKHSPAVLEILPEIKAALARNKTLLVLRGISEQQSRKKFDRAGFDGYAVEIVESAM